MKGADPEVFVTDMIGNIVPGIGLVGGSKEHPVPVQHGALQEDNVLAEFNITPAKTEDEWVDYLQTVMSALNYKLAKTGHTLAILATYDFERDVLESYGSQALTAGCDRDYNAWELAINPRPRLGTMRSAGGHIHIEMRGSRRDKAEAIRKHDLFLGVPAVLMDGDVRRHQLYGKAGSFRPKPYGVEYRTPSNFWLGSEELMRWAWRNSERAMAYEGEVDQLVRQCIDTHDDCLARDLVKQYDLEVLQDVANIRVH